MKYNYIIFHKGCIDGFTSYFILHKSGMIAKNAIIYPDVPSAKVAPPDIDGKHIISMDVAYKKDILKDMFHRAKSMIFLDHHVTIHDEVLKLKEEMGNNDNIKIIYDEMKSGASLTWNFLYSDRKPPLLVRYVEDNDIGLWKMKYTHYFIAGLEALYTLQPTEENLEKWNRLLYKDNTMKLIKRGKIYGEYIKQILELQSNRYSLEAFPSDKIYEQFSDHFEKPGQYKVAVYCGGGCPSSTLLGLKMLDKIQCDFVIMWVYHLDRKEYVLTFRSKSTNVGKIAQLFGGGGHKLASACSFPNTQYNIQDLFFNQSLPRR